jgi:uncharacterized protein (DUF1778 family)
MSPKKPEHREVPIKALVTPDEAKAVEAAAKAEDRTVSSWLRHVVRGALGLK